MTFPPNPTVFVVTVRTFTEVSSASFVIFTGIEPIKYTPLPVSKTLLPVNFPAL